MAAGDHGDRDLRDTQIGLCGELFTNRRDVQMHHEFLVQESSPDRISPRQACCCP